jgi:hypothetical protein
MKKTQATLALTLITGLVFFQNPVLAEQLSGRVTQVDQDGQTLTVQVSSPQGGTEERKISTANASFSGFQGLGDVREGDTITLDAQQSASRWNARSIGSAGSATSGTAGTQTGTQPGGLTSMNPLGSAGTGLAGSATGTGTAGGTSAGTSTGTSLGTAGASGTDTGTDTGSEAGTGTW